MRRAHSSNHWDTPLLLTASEGRKHCSSVFTLWSNLNIRETSRVCFDFWKHFFLRLEPFSSSSTSFLSFPSQQSLSSNFPHTFPVVGIWLTNLEVQITSWVIENFLLLKPWLKKKKFYWILGWLEWIKPITKRLTLSHSASSDMFKNVVGVTSSQETLC